MALSNNNSKAMRTHFKFILILILTSFCTGCIKNNVDQPENICLWGTSSVFSDVATKTEINYSEDVVKMLWSPNDSIGVFGTTFSNALFVSENRVAAYVAPFKSTQVVIDAPLYAYYPYVEDIDTYENVSVYIDGEQYYYDESSIAAYDVKASDSAELKSDGTYIMNYRQMASLLRFEVDLTGAEKWGLSPTEKIIRVEINDLDENEDGTSTSLSGSFSMNLSNLDSGLVPFDGEAASFISVNYMNKPLANGAVAYAVVAPGFHESNQWEVVLVTDRHWVIFNTVAKLDLEAGKFYTVPINAVVLDASTNTFNDEGVEKTGPYVEDEALPELLSFKFESSLNENKILDKELYYDETSGKTTVHSVDELKMDVGEDEVSGCIPYLYDWNLIPTFETTEDVVVLVNGEEQESGVSVQDFSTPVEYTLVCGYQERTYTVKLSNTGLPVVVVEQGTMGGLTESWAETGITVNSKDGDWGTNQITVYNPDGTENISTMSCGFRLRGNSTRNFPKKPFAVKLSSAANLLGIMPSGSHKRWCLLAGWTDRSLMRNAVAFKMADQTISGWKAANASAGLIWNPSGKHVELVLDGVHLGNYFLCEQIKISEDRLNINPPYEDVANPTTSNCGYLLEFDDNYDEAYKFMTGPRNLPCMFKDDVSTTLLNYVKDKVNNIESYLASGNYSAAFELLDIYSVIDWWFVYELAMNNEYRHPKSIYMYVNGDSKLFAGPVWDFDYQTFVNISELNEIQASYGSSARYVLSDYNAWLYGNSSTSPNAYNNWADDKPYMWYPVLFKSADFRNAVVDRWTIMKPYFEKVVDDIRSLGAELEISQEYNSAIWPLESLQRINYTWFIEYCGDELIKNWSDVVDNFVNVYQTRLNAMDSMITSGSFVTNAQ